MWMLQLGFFYPNWCRISILHQKKEKTKNGGTQRQLGFWAHNVSSLKRRWYLPSWGLQSNPENLNHTSKPNRCVSFEGTPWVREAPLWTSQFGGLRRTEGVPPRCLFSRSEKRSQLPISDPGKCESREIKPTNMHVLLGFTGCSCLTILAYKTGTLLPFHPVHREPLVRGLVPLKMVTKPSLVRLPSLRPQSSGVSGTAG